MTKRKSQQGTFFELNEEEKQPQIEVINIELWKPFMNVMTEIVPYALQVHDKFHLEKNFQKSLIKLIKVK